MKKHPLSERLRALALRNHGLGVFVSADLEDSADALDSAATFEADVLRIRGEIEWLTEENARLKALVESAYREGFSDGQQAGIAACSYEPTFGVSESWNDSTARAALPAERDEKP